MSTKGGGDERVGPARATEEGRSGSTSMVVEMGPRSADEKEQATVRVTDWTTSSGGAATHTHIHRQAAGQSDYLTANKPE